MDSLTPTNWLRFVICPLPSKPSPELLEHFLKSCDRDIVTQRAHIILETIFPNSSIGNVMDNIRAEEWRSETLKLFYRVLEAICKAEEAHANNLLTNEKLHRGLLACSAELVLTSNKIRTMLFPAVLERSKITAFDLSKGIDCFIRHEVSLPSELRNHLKTLEERILQSMVWEKHSSLYNSLAVAVPSLALEINRLGLSSLDNFSGEETFAEFGINSLFTKVNNLASVRIKGMVEMLHLSKPMRKSVCHLFRHLLVKRISLFFNRHIEQIMLCCFYAVAKISRMSLTFREIIISYRKHPRCKDQVFRLVFMESNRLEKIGQEHVDIITFYNQVFIAAARPLLVELGPVQNDQVVEANNNPEGQCPGSPKVPFPTTPDRSPKKPSSLHNVYDTPLQESKSPEEVAQP